MKTSEKDKMFKKIAARGAKLIPACEKIASEEGKQTDYHRTSCTTSVTYVAKVGDLEIIYDSGGWGNETRTIRKNGEVVFRADNYLRDKGYPVTSMGIDDLDRYGIEIYKPGDWEKLVLGPKNARDKIRKSPEPKKPTIIEDLLVSPEEVKSLEDRYKGCF